MCYSCYYVKKAILNSFFLRNIWIGHETSIYNFFFDECVYRTIYHYIIFVSMDYTLHTIGFSSFFCYFWKIYFLLCGLVNGQVM